MRYPFSAVIGEEHAKTALMCLLADRGINGVLIKGPSGTAKSVLIRSLAALTDRKLVDLPAGTGDEDIFGGIDFESAVKDGKSKLKEGILGRAHNNILCIDNINLLDPRTLNTITECILTKKVKIEREGISAEYPCDTQVIATMDPLERALPDSIADRFDICVTMTVHDDVTPRADVIEADLEFKKDPAAFVERFSGQDEEVRRRIEAASERIGSIKVVRRDIYDIVQICIKVNAIGHRGDIACTRVSRALAALNGRDRIEMDDIKESAIICLQHRRGPKTVLTGEARATLEETDNEGGELLMDDTERELTKDEIREAIQLSKDPDALPDVDEYVEVGGVDPLVNGDPDAGPVIEEEDDDGPLDAGPGGAIDVDVTTMLLNEVQTNLDEIDRIEAIHLNKVVGQIPRAALSGNRNGRASGFRVPEGRTSDPALGATIRAAAPYQNMRTPNGLSIVIDRTDIRENVRTKASSCSFLFAVDVSGSLSQTGMLDEAIKAVRAMLEDGYVRRDRVGLLTFGQNVINLAVPFTRNVENVFDALGKTVTGGATPLGQAMLTINKYMMNYTRKNPDEKCYIIMVTDGQADTAVTKGSEPIGEVRRICATIKIPNTQWVIIDNGSISRRVNYALKMANYLGGRYIPIRELLND